MTAVKSFSLSVIGAHLLIKCTHKNFAARALFCDSFRAFLLKQCVHDGFGLLRFKERLTGPEYAQREIKRFLAAKIDYVTESFVVDAHKNPDGKYTVLTQSAAGMALYNCKAIILACGCRERTSRQVFIHGQRPAGIFTAGTAQHFVNLQGKMPTKKCVILGSGDIGLIMARRLTLEGASVAGVYEIKDAPAGLTRNISQCLHDFGIPLQLSTTVTEVFGTERVEAVAVEKVDGQMNPIPGTREIIDCDALILSVGLLPEIELAKMLDISIDPATKGPNVDQSLMTDSPGVFACGNVLHVNDLVDWVSVSGEDAGRNAAKYCSVPRQFSGQAQLKYCKGDFLYAVPQYLDSTASEPFILYFRSLEDVKGKTITLKSGEDILFRKKYRRLVPSEMEAVTVEGLGNAADYTLEMQ